MLLYDEYIESLYLNETYLEEFRKNFLKSHIFLVKHGYYIYSDCLYCNDIEINELIKGMVTCKIEHIPINGKCNFKDYKDLK